jgi:hypothetical protein
MTVSDGISLVISPITTFIQNDDNVRGKLTNAGFTNINDIQSFAVDYIDINNKDLSKLAQLLYAILRDNNLTATFKTDIINNEQTLSNLFTRAFSSIDNSSLSILNKSRTKSFLSAIEYYNGTAADIESHRNTKALKYNLSHTDVSITHNGTSYGTVKSPYTGKIWLDRNLGASQVCDRNNSFTDNNDYVTSQQNCFGDYYQWG